MPVDPEASVRISAFNRVPDFAKGQVRDLRVRWALEEAGIPYAVRRLDAFAERPADYFQEQPFGQVPSYRDGAVSLFESGAIVLHIGERCEALLPGDPAQRARAVTWVIAALNSIEPWLMQLGTIDIFNPDSAWGKERRPELVRMIEGRLDRLADWLGNRDWLEERFTAGDLMMCAALRILDYTDLVSGRRILAGYKARCEGRPAFGRALAAHLADFDEAEASAAAAE